MTKTTLLLVAVLAATTLTSTTATAQPMGDCPTDVRQVLGRLVFEIKFHAGYTNRTQKRRMEAVRSAADALRRVERENPMMCHGWHQSYGVRALASADRLVDYLCRPHAARLLREASRPISEALAERKLAKAGQLAIQLEHLMRSPAIVTCPAVKDRTQWVKTQFLPQVRAELALPKLAQKAVAARDTVLAPWARARQALQKKGRRMRPATRLLDRVHGSTEMQQRIATCFRRVATLRSLGAKPDKALPITPSISLRSIANDCQRARDQLPTWIQKVTEHNAKHRSILLRAWVRGNLRGWDQRVVFNQLGRPAHAVSAKSGINWIYRTGTEQCQRYRFDRRGQRVGRPALVPCPRTSAEVASIGRAPRRAD